MKKRNISGIKKIPEIQRKYIAAAVIAVAFLLFVLLIVLGRGKKANLNGRTVEEDTIRYSLKWQGEEYEGTYTGSTVNGKDKFWTLSAAYLF